jgi:hypothetical protein
LVPEQNGRERQGAGSFANEHDVSPSTIRDRPKGANFRPAGGFAADELPATRDCYGCSAAPIWSATARAITSEVPPAANGTIMVIGCFGKSYAWAAVTNNAAPAASNHDALLF